MNRVHRKSVAAAGLAAVALFGAAACSSDSSKEDSTTTTSAAATTTTSAAEATTSAAAADPAANLVGTGCAAYAEQVPEGPGSVAGMAKDPVTVAASNNPMLKTLTQAVSGQLNPEVNLVDTLNGAEFTVIAPTDEAFGKLDAATIETLKTDAPLLTSILTYHVIPGQLTPDKIAGSHPTVQGAPVEVTGEGDALKFDETSNLVCGGVQTANAQVYMVDTVMMPPAS